MLVRFIGHRFHILLVATLLIFPCSDSNAEDNEDLDLIPDQLMSRPSPQTKSEPSQAPVPYRVKVFLDEALQENFERDSSAVLMPSSDFSRWNNRISLDMRTEVTLSPSWLLTVADRLNHFSDKDMGISDEGLLNDLKEAYLTWNVYGSDYIDVGRVNLKNGVAFGFNPTDYFKRKAVTARISEDNTILRENRLGVLMMRAQAIREKGGLTLAVAPEVPHEKDKWWTDESGGGLQLQRTNERMRLLAKAGVNGLGDMNPELLYFYDDGRSNVGLNLTRGLGDNIVIYGEWSLGQRPDIITEAMEDARSRGVIPPGVAPVIPGSTQIRFRNQLAMGFSYTEKVNRTTYFEYHYNEAGFSPEDWNNWLNAGREAAKLSDSAPTGRARRGILARLWAIRAFAQDAQEPLSRHSLFVRSSWQDGFVKSLDLTGILQINLQDGSLFLQPLAEYHLSSKITLSLALDFFLGSEDSEFGTLQQLGNIRAGVKYYF